ncbi:MAG: D-alanyl-D-alanine carboxypeptidase, partial [Eggerthellaceae bacterium]|nr:D-alanyl-D-alanine carboxypeptidase [Eggerthellaceae bacterium]
MSTAWASIEKSDIVFGKTVEDLGSNSSVCPSISAQYAILTDGNGSVYFERDADTQTHIASITKIMTAIIALDNAPLDTTVTVSAEAALIGESSAGLQSGDTMDLETALKALLIPSGNDAGLAIAECVGAIIDPATTDAVATFVQAMNDEASVLGMSNTLFANPHGLDSGSHEADMYSSARDVATMCAYAMQNDTFRDIVASGNTDITVTRANGTIATITLETTDQLIGVYDGACGIK